MGAVSSETQPPSFFILMNDIKFDLVLSDKIPDLGLELGRHGDKYTFVVIRDKVHSLFDDQEALAGIPLKFGDLSGAVIVLETFLAEDVFDVAI